MSELFFGLFLGFMVKATILLLGASVLDMLTRKVWVASAALRHWFWTLAYFMMLLIVPLSLWLPTLPFTVLPLVDISAESLPQPSVPIVDTQVEIPESTRGEHGAVLMNWRILCVSIWLTIAAMGLIRLCIHALRNSRFKQNATMIDCIEGIEVQSNSSVLSPMVSGWLQPVIFVPEAFCDWDEERRSSVLMHELAHIRRRDPLISACVAVASWLCWLHPLSWYGRRRFRLEREQACDDVVLASGARRSLDYADDLLAIARSLSHTDGIRGALGMASKPELELRLRAILDRERPRRIRLSSGSILSSVVLGLGILGVLAPARLSPSVQALVNGLRSPDIRTRVHCLQQLETRVTRREFHAVAPLALDEIPEVRGAALKVLRRIGCLPAMLAITYALDDSDPFVRQIAASELGHFQDPSWWRAKEAVLRREIWGKTETLVDYAIRARATEDAATALRRASRDPHLASRVAASLRSAGLN